MVSVSLNSVFKWLCLVFYMFNVICAEVMAAAVALAANGKFPSVCWFTIKFLLKAHSQSS